MAARIRDHYKKDVLDLRAKGVTRAQICNEIGISGSMYDRIIRDWKNENDIDGPEFDNTKGVSTCYDKNGDVVLRWVKIEADKKNSREFIAQAIESFKGKIPAMSVKPYAGESDNDLLSLYVITDYHFGMAAWAGETGEDWDIDIAEKTLYKWFYQAVSTAPASHTGVFCNLGDFIHFDSLLPITPTNKHVLDAAGRLPQVIESIIRVMRRIVEMLLDKHEHVHIIWAEGNHDEATSVIMRALFAEKYQNEPRISVDNSHIPYYGYEWGKTSLFFHHGHKRRMSGMTEAIVAQFREMIGRTEYSYIHCGHMHHRDVKENGIAIVEQHQTLSSKDSHCVRGGYNSHRSASVITYSKEYGEVSRSTIRPEIVNLREPLSLSQGP